MVPRAGAPEKPVCQTGRTLRQRLVDKPRDSITIEHLRDSGTTSEKAPAMVSHLTDIFELLLCARPRERRTTMIPTLMEQTSWRLETQMINTINKVMIQSVRRWWVSRREMEQGRGPEPQGLGSQFQSGQEGLPKTVA